jgi:hypothetical protein
MSLKTRSSIFPVTCIYICVCVCKAPFSYIPSHMYIYPIYIYIYVSKCQVGIVHRTLRILFSEMEERRGRSEEYEMAISAFEIYKESVYDCLLEDTKSILSPNKKIPQQRVPLEFGHRRDGREGVEVKNLSIVKGGSEAEVHALLRQANEARSIGKHRMNEESSRSHLVVILTLKVTNTRSGETSEGVLNFVDLAGSERLDSTGADSSADRLAEAKNINKSLSSLGDVISALGANSKHIPYRNSKLTYLLQDSLSRSSKALVIVTVAPEKRHVGETLASLQFAKRCCHVHLGARSMRRSVSANDLGLHPVLEEPPRVVPKEVRGEGVKGW